MDATDRLTQLRENRIKMVETLRQIGEEMEDDELNEVYRNFAQTIQELGTKYEGKIDEIMGSEPMVRAANCVNVQTHCILAAILDSFPSLLKETILALNADKICLYNAMAALYIYLIGYDTGKNEVMARIRVAGEEPTHE